MRLPFDWLCVPDIAHGRAHLFPSAGVLAVIFGGKWQGTFGAIWQGRLTRDWAFLPPPGDLRPASLRCLARRPGTALAERWEQAERGQVDGHTGKRGSKGLELDIQEDNRYL